MPKLIYSQECEQYYAECEKCSACVWIAWENFNDVVVRDAVLLRPTEIETPVVCEDCKTLL